MKAQTLIPIIFLVLFLGMQFEVNAQASASVSYTIVVTEDMLAGDDEEFDRGFGSDRFRDRINGTSNVTNPVAQLSFDDEKEFYIDEIEINPSDTQTVFSMLDNQISQLNDVTDAMIQAETTMHDNGQYQVVMEYN